MELKDIEVRRLNVEKLNETINSFLKTNEEGPVDFDYRVIAHNLCLATSKKGTTAIFDKELVGELIEGDVVKFEVIKKYKDGGMDMFPCKEVGFKIEELGEVLEESLNAEDFMEQRFNYNSRIKSNQAVFINFIISE